MVTHNTQTKKIEKSLAKYVIKRLVENQTLKQTAFSVKLY